MIDKKTEIDIKEVKGFLEFWIKFHAIYESSLSKTVTKEDEDKFLSTRDMIRNKYEELRGALDFNYMPHGRLTDPVADILAMNTIRFMSEKNAKKIEGDWKDSYIFLNNIIERLENKKRRLGQFNTVGVFFKRMFERK